MRKRNNKPLPKRFIWHDLCFSHQNLPLQVGRMVSRNGTDISGLKIILVDNPFSKACSRRPAQEGLLKKACPKAGSKKKKKKKWWGHVCAFFTWLHALDFMRLTCFSKKKNEIYFFRVNSLRHLDRKQFQNRTSCADWAPVVTYVMSSSQTDSQSSNSEFAARKTTIFQTIRYCIFFFFISKLT